MKDNKHIEDVKAAATELLESLEILMEVGTFDEATLTNNYKAKEAQYETTNASLRAENAQIRVARDSATSRIQELIIERDSALAQVKLLTSETSTSSGATSAKTKQAAKKKEKPKDLFELMASKLQEVTDAINREMDK